MDYQATTPLEPEVIDIIQHTLTHAWANPSSNHHAGVLAREQIDTARRWLARLVAAHSDEMIFNSGGTEGNNTVLHSALRYFHDRYPSDTNNGDHVDILPHIITSNVEHPAIEKVLEQFEKESLAEVTYVPVSRVTGRVEVCDVLKAVKHNTCLVTIMMVNNETGIIMPVAEISAALHGLKREFPILFHTDAAQAIGKIPVSVSDLGVDYLTVVGHKFYGPRIGALYVRGLSSGNTPYTPMLYGGGQERGYRPGTENTGMIAGLGKAAELVCLNLETYREQQRVARDYLEQCLKEIFEDKVHFNGKFDGTDRIPNVSNVSIEGEALLGAAILARCKHVQASVGAACHSHGKHRASHILLNTGIAEHIARNAVRLSVGRHTTTADIDIVVRDLQQAVHALTSNNC